MESKIKILVVDDEPGNIFYLERLLKYQDYDVITCDNGLGAIKKMHEESPDVVLLDIMMPNFSGIDVLDQVSTDDSIKDIPIIMCTAKTDSADVELTFSKGAVEYVRKPIDETELLARIRTIIKMKKYEDNLRDMVRSKEEFIRTVAHDLRTPFASISGFAELLKSDDLLSKSFTEEHIETLNYIIEASNFLVSYFNKLLFWAQENGGGKLKLTLNNAPIEKLIHTSIKLFTSKIELKKIELKLDLSENKEFLIDEIYFLQVINNLIGNAIKYTPSGGKISITTKTVSESLFEIIIADSGIGMNEELTQKINKNGKISSTPGTNNEKGTGLGLKICKRILEAHGFELTVESEIDIGTTMKIGIVQ